jgi:hypothetical protein
VISLACLQKRSRRCNCLDIGLAPTDNKSGFQKKKNGVLSWSLLRESFASGSKRYARSLVSFSNLERNATMAKYFSTNEMYRVLKQVSEESRSGYIIERRGYTWYTSTASMRPVMTTVWDLGCTSDRVDNEPMLGCEARLELLKQRY